MTTKKCCGLIVGGAVAILASACGSSSSNVAAVSVPEEGAAVLEGGVTAEVEGEEGSSLLSLGRLRGIFRFSPASGPVGSSVTLTGRALQTAESFVFAGSLFNTNDDVVVTNFTRNSDTEVVVTVPAGAVTGPIQAIDTNDRVETSVASFEVTSAGPGTGTTILNPFPTPGSIFGTSLSFLNNGLLVGAPGVAAGSGNAYVLNSNGNLAFSLNNPDPDAEGGDGFATALAAEGNLIVIGAPFDDTDGADAGIVYLFNRSTGNLVATLNDPTPEPQGNFGSSVAISGGLIAIGTPGQDADTAVNAAGEVHLFSTSGNLLNTIANPVPGVGDVFGFALGLSGDLLAVGAPGNEFASVNGAGSVYIYNIDPFPLTTPLLVETINNPGPIAGDSFGGSLAFKGDRLAVGTPGADDTATGTSGSGVVYLYTVNSAFCQSAVFCNASQTAVFESPNPRQLAAFGSAVAISPDESRVLVGEPLGSNGLGTAYLFNASFAGTLIDTFTNPGNAGDSFGISVALSDTEALVGAPLSRLESISSGRAYLFAQ
ncbi:MAG: hypothetical protein HC921_05160 [Synechococcaceae cyanobacterium SM2_3_1]|nr:hypothetical protein [Synechococcaceae cyanobacterium SM2_3_1]